MARKYGARKEGASERRSGWSEEAVAIGGARTSRRRQGSDQNKMQLFAYTTCTYEKVNLAFYADAQDLWVLNGTSAIVTFRHGALSASQLRDTSPLRAALSSP